MAGSTINNQPPISTDGTDNLVAQKGDNTTGKMPLSQVETWLDYYRTTVFVSSSAGAGDAGKPIVLDGAGLVDPSMLPGGAIVTSTSMARVDPLSSDAVDDNDLATHFSTIQGGYDAIVNAGGGTVEVTPGTYVETVYIRKGDPVSIVGIGGGGAGPLIDSKVVISPAAGKPCIVISEATQASLDILFAGGAANYDANYTATLVSDSGAGFPDRIVLENLTLDPQGPTERSLFIGGVDVGSEMLAFYGLVVRSCRIVQGLYARLGGYVSIHECGLNGTSRFFNLGQLYLQYTIVNGTTGFVYDTAEREPDPGLLGYNARYSHFSGAPITVEQRAEVEFEFCRLDRPSGDVLVVSSSGVVTARNCWFDEVTIDQFGAKIDADSCKFTTLDLVGGATLCTLKDCYVESLQNASAARLSLLMMGDEFNQLTEKVGPVGADLIVMEDSAASYAKKKVQVTNLPGGGPGSDTTAIHDNVAAEISAIPLKATPVSGDFLVIEDSAAANAKKRITVGTLPGGGGVFEVDAGNNEIQPILADKGRSFVVGSQSTEDTGTPADDSRMFFNKSDRTFRAGRALGTQWDSANRGGDSVAFGLNCIASGTQSIAHGTTCIAQAAGSQAWGNLTEVSGLDAVGGCAEGNSSKSYLRGQHAHTSDPMQIAGDAQYSRMTIQAQTSGAVTSEMFLDNTGLKSLTLPDERTWAFEMLFAVRQGGGTGGTIGNSAVYKALGCVKRVSGVVSLTGTVTYTTVAEDDASWPTPVVDVSGLNLRVRVTGVANQNIRWMAVVHLVEVFNGI
jgi:hypothetical protein